MSVVCESNWVDTYWLTKVFDELLSRIFTCDILSEVGPVGVFRDFLPFFHGYYIRMLGLLTSQ